MVTREGSGTGARDYGQTEGISTWTRSLTQPSRWPPMSSSPSTWTRSSRWSSLRPRRV